MTPPASVGHASAGCRSIQAVSNASTGNRPGANAYLAKTAAPRNFDGHEGEDEEGAHDPSRRADR